MMCPCGFTSCKKKKKMYLLHKRDNLQKVWEHEHEGIPEPKFRQIYGPHLQHILQDTNSRAEDPGPPRTVSAPPQPGSYNVISDCSGCLGRICQSPVSCREILATRPGHESSRKNLSSVLGGVFRLSMELNPSWKNSFLGEILLLYIVLKLLVGFHLNSFGDIWFLGKLDT